MPDIVDRLIYAVIAMAIGLVLVIGWAWYLQELVNSMTREIERLLKERER